MNTSTSTKQVQALHCQSGDCQSGPLELIGEEPLLIRVEAKPYAVVMRTPGQELFHAAGFCLGEGIADTPDDFLSIGYCEDLDPNVVDVRLKPKRLEEIPDLLERKGFVSQTSCGICGKEMLKDLQLTLTPAKKGVELTQAAVVKSMARLFATQDAYPRTKGSHAALILDQELQPLSFAEDVGRHNALDKAIGKPFMNRVLDRAGLVALSSRISYELVQKAARARLEIMVSKSRPTGLAAELGQALNMTLVCVSEKTKLHILCGEQRIADR